MIRAEGDIEADRLRKAIVDMLNMIGNQDRPPCKENKCEGCLEDTWHAWAEGLEALGYKPTADSYFQMMRDNFPGFPSKEELDNRGTSAT